MMQYIVLSDNPHMVRRNIVVYMHLCLYSVTTSTQFIVVNVNTTACDHTQSNVLPTQLGLLTGVTAGFEFSVMDLVSATQPPMPLCGATEISGCLLVSPHRLWRAPIIQNGTIPTEVGQITGLAYGLFLAETKMVRDVPWRTCLAHMMHS